MIPFRLRECRRFAVLCSALLAVPSLAPAQVADGTVRSFTPSFTTPPIRAATLDSSGRIVAISTANSATGAFRLNLDGTRDTSFATVTYNSRLMSLLIQADGRILVGGFFTALNQASIFRSYIVRLNTDGTLDTSFPSSFTGTAVLTLAPGSGGKFYAGKREAGIQRYSADGVLDTSFISPTIGSGYSNGKVFAIRELPDGKVMVSHQYVISPQLQTIGQKIERLTSTGAVDPTFTAPAPNAPLHSFDILPDGRIAIIGEFTEIGGVPRNRLALLKADGSLDTSFDPGTGMEFFDTGENPHLNVKFLDDRLYFYGGITTVNGEALRGIARLKLDGSIDTAFAIGAVTNNGTGNGKVYSLVSAANGDLLIAGIFTSVNSQSRYYAAYLAHNDNVVADPFLAYLIAAGVPANQRDPFDDADKDGITNLMEYALDLRPMVADTASLPKVDKDGVLKLTYKHAHADVTYTVETSTNLDDASSWSATGVNQGTPAPDGTTTASIPSDGPHRFLRLQVSR